MRIKYSLFLVAALLTVGMSAEAFADGFDVRQFTPIAGSEGVFSVESTKTLSHTNYDIKVLVDYANTPLQYTTPYGDTAKLEHMVSMTISGAIGLLDFLEVGVSLPVSPYEGANEFFGVGDAPVADDALINTRIPSKRGYFGDMQVRAKGTILKREDYNGFGLGAGVIFSIPTGKQDALIGSPSFWGRPYVAADYEIGPVEMMLNAGFTFRKEAEFLDYKLMHAFNYGFGVNYHVIESWLDIRAEIFGETPLSSIAEHEHQNSAEFLGGVKVYTPIGLHFTAGAGTGLGDGVRNPEYRILFGAEFQPAGGPDTDGDGIPDSTDACPTLAGDKAFHGCPDPDADEDGWCAPWIESEKLAEEFQCRMTDECPDITGDDVFNGCPMPDRDDDGWCDEWIEDPEIADKYGCKISDMCPDIPGTDEYQGCLPADTDKDGWCDPWITDQAIADQYNCKMTDRCPDLAGTDDYSGCPNADADGDGICAPFVDELGLYDMFFCSGNDMCPDEAEDFDGFDDEDGCADPDNDHDGICDPWVSESGQLEKYAQICRGLDKCPTESETINGYKDDDGCPDKGKQLVFVLDDKIEIKDKIYFDNNKSTIKKKSYSLLDQIVATIQAHPEIKHLTIEGHTDDTGKYEHNIMLSRQRAQAVADYLVSKGLSADRFTAVGFGPDKPIDPAKTSKARALNRRVEFIITEKQ